MEKGDNNHPTISWEGKLEFYREWIKSLEVKLLEEKGFCKEEIGLMVMLDDKEEIQVEGEKGKKKEKIQSLIYYLNVVNGMLEEELNNGN